MSWQRIPVCARSRSSAGGARLDRTCEIAGVDVRSLQRRKAGQVLELGDGQPLAVRSIPAHALTQVEREMNVQVANDPRFADKPPASIVPALADEVLYLAKETSVRLDVRGRRQTTHLGRPRSGAGRRSTSWLRSSATVSVCT